MYKGMMNSWHFIVMCMLWMMQAAQAHGGPGHEHGLLTALLHPLQAWDHFLALLIVSLLLCATLWLSRAVRHRAPRVILQFGSITIAIFGIALLSQ